MRSCSLLQSMPNLLLYNVSKTHLKLSKIFIWDNSLVGDEVIVISKDLRKPLYDIRTKNDTECQEKKVSSIRIFMKIDLTQLQMTNMQSSYT